MREAMLVDLAKRLEKETFKAANGRTEYRKKRSDKSGDQEKAMQLAQQIVLVEKAISQEVETK